MVFEAEVYADDEFTNASAVRGIEYKCSSFFYIHKTDILSD